MKRALHILAAMIRFGRRGLLVVSGVLCVVFCTLWACSYFRSWTTEVEAAPLIGEKIYMGRLKINSGAAEIAFDRQFDVLAPDIYDQRRTLLKIGKIDTLVGDDWSPQKWRHVGGFFWEFWHFSNPDLVPKNSFELACPYWFLIAATGVAPGIWFCLGIGRWNSKRWRTAVGRIARLLPRLIAKCLAVASLALAFGIALVTFESHIFMYDFLIRPEWSAGRTTHESELRIIVENGIATCDWHLDRQRARDPFYGISRWGDAYVNVDAARLIFGAAPWWSWRGLSISGASLTNGTAYVPLGVPIIFCLLPPLAWYIVFVVSRTRARRERDLNLCANCGYDLRATPDRCPECGDVPRPA